MTMSGEILAGRYKLVHRVATGGMGSVWEAWDELLHRRVAIKELLPQPGLSRADAEMARSRVIREARITARLHHPNAVSLYDVIDHDGQPCLILQYVPSRTLNSLMAEQGLLQVPFVTGIGAEVASALAAAHRVGIVHRDVKPGNVLITPVGAAMITDFGISHAAGDVSLTSTGMVTGTPAFLAPEVARGATSGFPADVFSLGATLYAALEGMPPFGTDQNAMAILHKVASGQIIPPRRSGGLTSLLGRMLAADPASRPPMSEVAQLLAAATVQQPPRPADPSPPTIAAPRPTVREWPTGPASGPRRASEIPEVASISAPVRPAAGRRRPLGVLAAAAVLLLAGVGAWLLVGAGQHAPPAAGATSSNVQSLSTAGSVHASPPHHTAAPTTGSVATSSAGPTPGPPTHAPLPTPSTVPSHPATRPAATTPTARTTTAATVTTASRAPRKTSTAAPSSSVEAPPTSTELAAAITDYYALLPGNTDQGWARLTSNFQTGIAQNRQYYQNFWAGVDHVTATAAHGASPDTAEATITYYFKDGRIAVEPTVYSLVQQDGILKIDSSTVLSSTTQ